jgi:hypothetical protein
MSMSTLLRHRTSLVAVPAAGVALMMLAACGGTTASASSAPGSAGNNSAATNNQGNGGGRNFPGANGKIAEIDGKTLQVQSDTTQTAVTYTGSTKMSQTVAAARSDLAVGKCISVRPVQSADASATPAAPDDATPVAAGSVTISDPVNGSCTGGFGGFGGPRGNGGFRGQGFRGQDGANGATGAPQGAPNGQTAQGFRGGTGARGVNGKVSAINGDIVTVESQRPQVNQNNGSAASSAPTMTTVTRTVTLSSSTTYTKTESASSSDLKVGRCVTALGSTDSNGTLTATMIALRPAQNGSCTAGFGGRFNGTGAGAPAASNS